MSSIQKYRSFSVLAFTLILFLPLCFSFYATTNSSDSLDENRTLATRPKIPVNLQEWIDYPKKFERYYKDNFGLRSELLLVAKGLKQIFGMSPDRIRTSGRESWVYLESTLHLNGVANPLTPSDQKLASFAEKMQLLGNFFAERNVVFAHFVAPEKASIYPEFLPRRYSFKEKTLLDRTSAALGQNREYIDVATPLRQYKAQHPGNPVYFESNSHWNCLGAYRAYLAVISHINRALVKKATVVQEKDITFKDLALPQRKNLFSPQYWLSSLAERDSKMACLMEESPSLEMILRSTGEKMININGEKDPPEIGLSAKHALFMDWVSQDKGNTSGLTALVFRDSFGSYLAPYFSRSFTEVHYVHINSLTKGRHKSVLKRIDPDVIIYQYAERQLKSPQAGIFNRLVEYTDLKEHLGDGLD